MNPPPRAPGHEPYSHRESTAATERTRVVLNLTQEDLNRLQKVAEELKLSVGEVLQRSIATTLFLQDQINKGSKILIQSSDGTLGEFVLT